jgi:mono/diheme cytochrome c family protein
MKYLIIAAAIFFASCTGNSSEKPKEIDNTVSVELGESLFKANCSNCHKRDEDFTGPKLRDVESKWPDKTLLYDFIRNSQDVISRNEYAKKLFEQYKQAPMLPFPQLTDKEIDAILNYCKTGPI